MRRQNAAARRRPRKTWPAPSWTCSAPTPRRRRRPRRSATAAKAAVRSAPARRSSRRASRTRRCGALEDAGNQPRNRGSRRQAVPDDQHRPAHRARQLDHRPAAIRSPPASRSTTSGRHFGKPLVADRLRLRPQGDAADPPELLDWLAVELMEHGWSMKHLHRLIVTSDAYRLTSSSAERRPGDPGGRPGEPLLLADEPGPDGGAGRARQPAAPGRRTRPDARRPVDPGRTTRRSRRRSLYFVHSHNDHHKFLSMFDDASVLRMLPADGEHRARSRRWRSANSPLALAHGRRRSRDRLQPRARQGVATRRSSRAAFETVLARRRRPPTSGSACERRPGRTGEAAAGEARHGRPGARPRDDLVHALLNHNDFVTDPMTGSSGLRWPRRVASSAAARHPSPRLPRRPGHGLHRPGPRRHAPPRRRRRAPTRAGWHAARRQAALPAEGQVASSGCS